MKNLIIFIYILVSVSSLINCKENIPNDIPDAKNSLIESIEASSTLSPDNQYSVKNLIDKTRASWSEGAEGDGIDYFFRISFKEMVKIKTIYIKNGYGIPGYFRLNNRVKKLVIVNENNKVRKLFLADERELTEYKLSEPLIGKQFDFVIGSVHKGTAYSDTCLTEISFEKLNFDSDWDFNIKNYFVQLTNIQELNGKKLISEFGEEMTYSTSELIIDESNNFVSHSISYAPIIEEKIYGVINHDNVFIKKQEYLSDDDKKPMWKSEKIDKNKYPIKIYKSYMKKAKKEYPTWFDYKDYEYTNKKTQFPVLFITDSPIGDLYFIK